MTSPNGAAQGRRSDVPERVRASRMTERVSADREQLRRLLADVPVGHVGFVTEDGQPYVIPTAISPAGDDVLLHGSTGSRWMRLLATGIPVSLAVTALDGILVARSAFESSMHYRSAVLFGRCTALQGEEKLAALDALTDALIPGRVAEVRRPSAKELAATMALRLTVEDWTIKVSDGQPDDLAEDVAGPAWAGIVPLVRRYTEALDAPDLRPGIELPASVRRMLQPEDEPAG
ncbi:pyridoxamine 5'-phosphate oxidase family protein [Jatrophihabitans sp.]|uniref:pyridoxamine 5'-phosphate oxidase family protein n=1 Tax=Jatrophihabitans sp. TaxID=1932789 RepID=UPI002B8CD497|nr:pyridoxamine 5'-phosphate oxidase family protein [Jatrophihabitans sp.]